MHITDSFLFCIVVLHFLYLRGPESSSRLGSDIINSGFRAVNPDRFDSEQRQTFDSRLRKRKHSFQLVSVIKMWNYSERASSHVVKVEFTVLEISFWTVKFFLTLCLPWNTRHSFKNTTKTLNQQKKKPDILDMLDAASCKLNLTSWERSCSSEKSSQLLSLVFSMLMYSLC